MSENTGKRHEVNNGATYHFIKLQCWKNKNAVKIRKVRHWKTGGMDWKMTWRCHTVWMSNPDWLEFFIVSALTVSWPVSTRQEGLKIVHSSCFLGPWRFLLLLFFLVSCSRLIFFLFLVFVSFLAAFLVLLEQKQDFSLFTSLHIKTVCAQATKSDGTKKF